MPSSLILADAALLDITRDLAIKMQSSSQEYRMTVILPILPFRNLRDRDLHPNLEGRDRDLLS